MIKRGRMNAMFTGIVEAMAEVLFVSATKLTLRRPSHFDDVKLGGSICVSGICLTITDLSESSMTFDVVSETLKKSTFGALKEGDFLNLERAMKVSDRFDGHIVQGHGEGTATIASIHGGLVSLVFPSELISFVVPKGSVTLDGVSLTVASLDGNLCSVALIPRTRCDTTLGLRKEGDSVNVETDILGRYVQHLLPPHV